MRQASRASVLVLIALAMNTSDATESPSSCAAKTRIVSDLCSAFGEQTPACASSRTQLAAGCKKAGVGGTRRLKKAGVDGTRLGDTSASRLREDRAASFFYKAKGCKGVPDPSKGVDAKYSAKCMQRNVVKAEEWKECRKHCDEHCEHDHEGHLPNIYKCKRKCKAKCSSDHQCFNGEYQVVRPIKTIKLITYYLVKVLGTFHFAVCPMRKNSSVGDGKCCVDINMDGKIGQVVSHSNTAKRCIIGEHKSSKVFPIKFSRKNKLQRKQCADWQNNGKKKEESLFGDLFGEDATFGGRRRRASSRRRRAGFFKKVVKRASKQVAKVKKAAAKVKKAAKKTVKKGVAIAKKTAKKGISMAKKGLSGAMAGVLKMVLSKLPKGIRPFISDAVSTYMKTKSITKTLLKVLPLVLSKLPKGIRARAKPALKLVQVAITKFLQTKSITGTLKAVWDKEPAAKEALNALIIKYITWKVWLKLGTNPCSVDCLCNNVLDPFLNQKMTMTAHITTERNADKKCWRTAKKGTQEYKFEQMSKKFDFHFFPAKDRGSVIFTRTAVNDIPEMNNWHTKKKVKKGDVVCQARFNVLTAICMTCCCKKGKISTTVGSAMTIQRVDACSGWFQLLDQGLRAAVNIAASVTGVTTQMRCQKDFHDKWPKLAEGGDHE